MASRCEATVRYQACARRVRSRIAIITDSSTVRCGNVAEIWNERTMPMRAIAAGREPVISRPLNMICPEVGVRKCVSRLKQVVLPAPLGPISA